ncbi:alkaline phosphatase [Aestuariibacter halophilus]|uniref:Alkaline phosphatase n=1 Tax=Fluctibacter halophilus TaxID=226011 RepID=A0ABS8G484_9ALTE|nr:alkaline phosphatase [Aestuariibacter halophilus]MCC2614916.1 alkaline phosphatase [Aestuariibacter halophilus]
MKLFLAATLSVMAFTGFAAEQPKNIIMVVGDGMGPAYTTAYRYFADDRASAEIDWTVFDRHLKGMASTYPARVSGYVTDSAAGATALSSATKSYNGAIAVDVEKAPTPTVLEWAKQRGMKTGVAVTSQVNHATPASYAAHNEYRRNYDEIADSYFDDRVGEAFVLDVILGGGWEYFIREDRNLVEEFKAAGYQYVDDMAALSTLTPGKPVLGLFADTGMPWALDTPTKQRLPALTKAAVKQLENDNGFFLLVEGSQVDWAGHANDVASAMAEMHDLAMTLEYLESYVKQNPDTLVVVTADHSTGGFTIAANKDYRWEPDWLKNLKMSVESLAKALVKSDTPVAFIEENLGFALNEQEKATVNALQEADEKTWFKTVSHILDVRSNTGWTTSGHTAVDVQVFAMGKGSEVFKGHMDNTDISRHIFKMLGKTE